MDGQQGQWGRVCPCQGECGGLRVRQSCKTTQSPPDAAGCAPVPPLLHSQRRPAFSPTGLRPHSSHCPQAQRSAHWPLRVTGTITSGFLIGLSAPTFASSLSLTQSSNHSDPFNMRLQMMDFSAQNSTTFYLEVLAVAFQGPQGLWPPPLPALITWPSSHFLTPPEHTLH